MQGDVIMVNCMNDGRAKVVVVGAGFGGIKVARSLAGKNVDVTIIDSNFAGH